jgi:hypothetical protein
LSGDEAKARLGEVGASQASASSQLADSGAPQLGAAPAAPKSTTADSGANGGVWNDPQLRLPQVAPPLQPSPSSSALAVPLPRVISSPPVKAQAEDRWDLTSGANGLPVVGGGLVLLLGGLWVVAKAERTRSQRKTQPML